MTPNDVKIVADNIEDFIELPDGIERLTKAVLTLAVSGKLVPQDKKEGTGEELFTQIQKVQKIKQNGLKIIIKKLSEITPEEIPFDIPKTWKWIHFGIAFTNYGSGSTPTRGNDDFYDNGQINWYKSGELNDGVLSANAEEMITDLAINKFHLRFNKPGDLLIAMYGATAGRVSVLDNEGTTNQAVWGGTPHTSIDVQYLFYYILQSRHVLLKTSSGAAQPNISGEKIITHLFPLPPYQEQKRIVKKIEEVMSQLDELETKKRERDEVRSKLTRSAMFSLGKGESKIAFEHLTKLIKTKSDVKEFENAILTLAVSGKLMPQYRKEGTGEDLYTQIQKMQKIEQNGPKKINKTLSEIKPEEIPFEIPKSWKWVEMSEIANLITDGEHISPEKHTIGVPLITAKNVLEKGVNFDNVDYVTNDDAKKFWNRCKPELGDLLICSRGTIGRTTIVDTRSPFCLMGSVILIKFFDDTLSNYCKYYLRTHFGVAQIGLLKKGMAVSALYLKDIKKALIPLPPLGEQKRIVKKVEEIKAIIDKLLALSQ